MAQLSPDGTKILNYYDRFTGVPFNATKINTWYDGTAMDDSKVDSVIYFKVSSDLGSGYARRDYEGYIDPRWYGLKLDGITDDTDAFNYMFQTIEDNSSILFDNGICKFDTAFLIEKKFISLIGGGTIFTGTIVIGNSNLSAPVFPYSFSAEGLIFDHTLDKKNCFEFVNCQNFSLEKIKTIGSWNTGSKAIAYIQPLDKIQHVNRCSIKASSGFADYLLFADNPINVAPYAGIKMTLGDIEITGNFALECKICNILGFGIDGILSSGNTHFMTSNFYRSQIKNQNIRLVGCNFIRIIGESLFESGLESILFERCRNIVATGLQIAWPGQRDVNYAYGIRLTGKGYTDVNYTTSVISEIICDRCPGTVIKLDEGCQRVIVHGIKGTATGNGSFYYGTSTYPNGLPAGDPNNTPLVSSVTHYCIETHPNIRWCSIHDNTDDNAGFLFGFDESLAIPNRELLIHYNNAGNGGQFESQSNTITALDSGRINTNGKNNIILDIATGVPVITDIINARVGDVVMLYNRNELNISIENNANIQLAFNANTVINRYTTMTLQKRTDKWYEVSKTIPATATPNSLSVSGPSGSSRDFIFRTSGVPRWIERVNSTSESGNNSGSDYELIARNDAGGLLGIVSRIYRATLNWHIGDVANDILPSIFSVNSVTKGSLPFPRMNTTQRDAIVNPSQGLMIENLSLNRIQRFDSVLGSWQDIKEVKGSVVNKVSNYTMQLSDYGANGVATIYLDAAGAPFTLTLLPAAIDIGYTTKVVKIDASPNVITVKGNGSELINNSNTDTTLSIQYASFILDSNGIKHFKF